MGMMILDATDWQFVFVPAFRLWLGGLDPYTAVFFNPPWLLPILAPFALLGDIGRILSLLSAIAAFGYTAYRLGGKPFAVAAFIVSPFVFDSLAWGNVEWLAILGAVVNPAVGLMLLAIKPQMTLAVMLYILVETYRAYGWRRVAVLCAPLALITAGSFVLFGLWPLHLPSYLNNGGSAMNLSLFPWSVPVGVYLFAMSLRYRRIHYAIAASPMFFPVVTPQVWLVVFLALAGDAPALITSTLAYWGVIVLQAR